MCGGNKNTTTSTTAPAPGIVPALNQAAQQVSAASQLPFQPVLQGTAGPTAQQTLAGNTLDYTAQPMLQGAANPLTAAQIQQYYNPYQQDVIAATQAEFNNQNAQQQNQVVGNAVSQGAWGGDRSAVAQALTAQQQQLAQAPVIAGLEQQGYTQALGTAAQQYQQNPEAVANQLTNLGLAQYGVGTQAQQTQQQAYNAQYAEQLAAAGYPFQAASFNAGNIGGLAGAFGGTSQTTTPPPSIWNAAAGLGTAGIGLAMLSDRRAKEDIRAIGKTKDGQTIYRFRYKGHPQWQIGLMAQDVEKKNPDAVHEIAGVKAVDIKKATDAAARAFGGRIQGLQTGGVPYNAGVTGAAPYAGPENYVPTPAHISGGIGLPRPSQQPQQDGSTQMFQNALKMAGGAGGSGNGLLTNTSFGDTVSDTLQDIGDAAGGRVSRAYGGLAIPSSNRINVPTRSGFGMPSFMSRGGLAEGGTPDDDVVTDTASPPPVVSEAAPEGVQVAQAAPPSGVATDAPDIITKGPEAVKANGSIDRLKAGVAHVETGGERNPYGSVTSTGTGHKVYGKYQIYDANIPIWTQQALGRSLTPAQFLASPEAQEAVAGHKLGEYASKYGYAGAARAWLAGEGGMNNPTARDKFGSDPYGYSAKVMAHAGLGDGGEGTQALAFDGTPAPQKGVGTTAPDSGIPGVTPINPSKISSGANNTDVALSLMAAGLGMMGSRSPYAGVGIGQGGLQGVGTYEALRKQRIGEAEHQAQLQLQTDVANQRPEIQQQLFGQQKAQQERQFAQQLQMEAKRAEDARALEAMKEFKTVQTIWDDSTGRMRNVITRGDGTKEDILTHEILGTPRGQTPAPTQTPTPQNPTQPMPSNPRNASVTAPTQLVSADPGFRVRNTQFVESGQSFNYASGDTPHIEKGMVVPEPQAIAGNSVDSLKTDAKTYLQTGKLPQVSRGASPVAVSQQAYQRAVKNYANAVASSLGMTHDQVAETMRQGGMMPRFILGPAGQATVSLGTAVRHLDTLREFAKAWDANDIQTVNRLRTTISREFGDDAATNLETVGKIVGPEIIKAIGVAGAGTADERAGAAAQFSTIASGKQMLGAIDVTQKLLGGQLEGKKRQAAASGVSEETFKNLIGDRPYEILTGIDKGKSEEGATAATNAPKTGDVVKGYKFKGGNPADKNNWEKQ